MKRTVVLNVVGLTRKILGEHTPQISDWARTRHVNDITPVMPAVTCTMQATYYTGVMPVQHGIVGNGWYFRDECEIHFWRQSNKLIQSRKIWEVARQGVPGFTCANLFGWFNMYSSADYSVTPRPMYPADGRKIPDIYTEPPNLREELQQKLGTFPLFEFWGPRTSINSTRWIGESAKYVENLYRPTLTFVYLPHLDYGLQRFGPDHLSVKSDFQAVDEICGDLIRFYESRGVHVNLLSEYGIGPVSHPVHLNRILRKAGLIRVREQLGREVLDPGASAAFAVSDHQIAHVYVNDHSKLGFVRDLLERTSGIEIILDDAGKRQRGTNHARAGEIVAVASPNAWFTYYYWLDDKKAPDFARTVDIHRKPGYDPVELFIDPAIKLPKLKVAYKLLKRELGFRDLLDLIPLDASLVKGSHGRVNESGEYHPVFVGAHQRMQMQGVDVFSEIMAQLGVELDQVKPHE
jgi:predicted AlkP superfamily pyrophosphatase or phosphodiesterase